MCGLRFVSAMGRHGPGWVRRRPPQWGPVMVGGVLAAISHCPLGGVTDMSPMGPVTPPPSGAYVDHLTHQAMDIRTLT